MFEIKYSSHNWLIKQINNQNIIKNKDIYRGVLYDLGCGTKPYLDFIAPLVEQYIGVDWSNTSHQHKMDIIADLNQALPISAEVADTVICLQTLEHLCEPQQLLDEAYRILKPNGKILLTVPFMWSLHEEPYDFFRYTEYGLAYMFKKAGFSNIKITTDTGFWVTHSLRINYHTHRYARFIGSWWLVPFWWLNQTIAPFLDKFDENRRNTSSYLVTAQKIK
jgi:SAM-dependent methyltransferase